MGIALIEIDETLLIRLAGARAFGCGLHYFEEGRVSTVESTEKSTTAIFHGCHRYNVRLRHTHRILEGACDCPASDGIDFCKHCVTVALVLHEGQAPAKSMDKRSALRRIRHYLSQQAHEELIEELMSIAKHDRVLRDDLLQKVQFATETLSYAKLRKMIKSVMPRRYLWEFATQIIRHADKQNGQVTLLLFDIDNFKSYNDDFGHDGPSFRAARQKNPHRCRGDAPCE